MKIAICDGDADQICQIKACLQDYTAKNPGLKISAFTSGDRLIAAYKKGHRYDVIFLNTGMKNSGGLEAAKAIRSYDLDAILIFISECIYSVLDTFYYNAFQFLLKPISKEKIDDEMKRVLDTLRLKRHKYVVKNKQGVFTVEVKDITYLEGYDRHIKVRTIQGGLYECVGKMGDAETKLSCRHFVRTHQGFLANMEYIKEIRGRSILLSNGADVPISVRRRVNVLREYNKYLVEYAVGD